MKKLFLFPCVAFIMLLANACGDDESSATAVAGVSIEEFCPYDSSAATSSDDSATATSSDESTTSKGSISCTVFESGMNAYTIQCPDGTNVTVHDGRNGIDGQNGADGKDGADGQNGADGKDGVDGQNGADGKNGVDGQNGASSVDTLVNNKTSCTIKDNKDGTYTIVCPDGTSATVSNGTVANAGQNVDFNSTTISFSTFELSYNTSELLYIYDYKKYMAGMKDDAEIKIYSTSDTAGITVKASPSAQITSYYEVYYYVVPGKSHDNYVHASRGDTIYFKYNSGHNLSSDNAKKEWNIPDISKEASLKLSKKICYGDSAILSVILTDDDLVVDSIQLTLTINEISYKATLEGAEGYYSAELMFVKKTPTIGRNIYPVKDTAEIVIKYKDESSGMIISDEAKWLLSAKASIMFDDDAESFSGKTSITVYLYDDDNLKSKDTVWVKNEQSGDSLNVVLNKYSGYSYFFGSFYVDNQNTNECLYVPDTTYITVSYYDESADEIIQEQDLLYPYPCSESVSMNFMEKHYYGVTDKAQISFYSGCTETESIVSFSVKSTSDPVGFKLQSIYYSSYKLNNALVGFTEEDTREGFIHVEAKDTVYATYVSESGKEYVAKTVWESEF